MRSLTSPPRALRKAKLDNLALVPGSLLPFKAELESATLLIRHIESVVKAL